MITLGGDAELELVDSLDPFAEGILFRWGWRARGGGGDDARWLQAWQPANEGGRRPPPLCKRPWPSASSCAPSPHTPPHAQRAPPQEELEEHCQPVWRGEDAVLALPCLCAAPLQAHPAVRDGRDRRGAGWVNAQAEMASGWRPGVLSARRPTLARAPTLPPPMLTPPQTSRTCPSWVTTSRSAPATPSLSSSPCATTCSSWPTGWWASTRPTTPRSRVRAGAAGGGGGGGGGGAEEAGSRVVLGPQVCARAVHKRPHHLTARPAALPPLPLAQSPSILASLWWAAARPSACPRRAAWQQRSRSSSRLRWPQHERARCWHSPPHFDLHASSA